MTKKRNYIDECLEHANAATEGPWIKGKNEMGILGSASRIEIDGPDYLNVAQFIKKDAQFIAHARQDVPELARRLKRAIEHIRNACNDGNDMTAFLEELEAPLEEK